MKIDKLFLLLRTLPARLFGCCSYSCYPILSSPKSFRLTQPREVHISGKIMGYHLSSCLRCGIQAYFTPLGAELRMCRYKYAVHKEYVTPINANSSCAGPTTSYVWLCRVCMPRLSSSMRNTMILGCRFFAYRTKIWMGHGLLGCQPLLQIC